MFYVVVVRFRFRELVPKVKTHPHAIGLGAKEIAQEKVSKLDRVKRGEG